MAISIDWATKVITVPQADLTLIGGTLYELNTETFRTDIKVLEGSEIGIAFDDAHEHVTEKTLSGVVYARFVEIINGYTVTFTPDASYRVRFAGSNNNILDVANLNSVSLAPQNSAGLIKVDTTSELENGLVITGSTSQVVRTDISKANGFYDGVLVQIANSAGTMIRRVDQYRQTNGEMDLSDPLPFVPLTGDIVVILTSSHQPRPGGR